MTTYPRAQADRIIDMSKDILQMQFPSLRIVPNANRPAGDCIVTDENAEGEPYVGAYVGGRFFVVIVSQSCLRRMASSDEWIARILSSTAVEPNRESYDIMEVEERCETPAALISKIAMHLDAFRPYDAPHVIFMSSDCKRILSMPEYEWEADVDNGNVPGNFISVVHGTCTEDAMRSFAKLHPRTDEFLQMCGINTCDPEGASLRL